LLFIREGPLTLCFKGPLCKTIGKWAPKCPFHEKPNAKVKKVKKAKKVKKVKKVKTGNPQNLSSNDLFLPYV